MPCNTSQPEFLLQNYETLFQEGLGTLQGHEAAARAEDTTVFMYLKMQL